MIQQLFRQEQALDGLTILLGCLELDFRASAVKPPKKVNVHTSTLIAPVAMNARVLMSNCFFSVGFYANTSSIPHTTGQGLEPELAESRELQTAQTKQLHDTPIIRYDIYS